RLCQYHSLETDEGRGRLAISDVDESLSLSPRLEVEAPKVEWPENSIAGSNYLGLALFNFFTDKYGGTEIGEVPEGYSDSTGGTNRLREFALHWSLLSESEARQHYRRVMDRYATVDISEYRLRDKIRNVGFFPD